MLTKNTITYIKSLHEKKGRNETQSFLVEGEKNLIEFLDSDFEFLDGYFSSSFIEKYGSKFDTRRVAECSVSDIEKITSLSKNTVGVGIFAMKKLGRVDARGIVLVLDGINDPGNLGTIIRTADWYGVKTIIASHNTVDIYNPKVIMATMGSFSRVQVHYRDLSEYLEGLQGPIYGAYLDGENIHTKKIGREDVYLVIGSESHGISQAIESYITDKITIPRFGSAESLNAGVATAIILDNICRK